MDAFFEIIGGFATVSPLLRIIAGALIGAVLLGAAFGVLPEYAQKRAKSQSAMSAAVITQSGGGIQINNIGNTTPPAANQGAPARIVVTRITLHRKNAQDLNSPMEWRIDLPPNGTTSWRARHISMFSSFSRIATTP